MRSAFSCVCLIVLVLACVARGQELLRSNQEGVSLGEAIETWSAECGIPLRVHWSLDENRIVSTKGEGRTLLAVLEELGLDIEPELGAEGWLIKDRDPRAAYADGSTVRLRAFRHLVSEPDGQSTVIEILADHLAANGDGTWEVVAASVDGEEHTFATCTVRGGKRVKLPGVSQGTIKLGIIGQCGTRNSHTVSFCPPRRNAKEEIGDFSVTLAWPNLKLMAPEKMAVSTLETMLDPRSIVIRLKDGTVISGEGGDSAPMLGEGHVTWCGCQAGKCKIEVHAGERKAREIGKSSKMGRMLRVPATKNRRLQLGTVAEVECSVELASFREFEASITVPDDGPAPRPNQLITAAPDTAQEGILKEFGEGFRLIQTDHFDIISDTPLRYHEVTSAMFEQFYREVHPRFFTQPMPRLRCYFIDGGVDYEEFVTARGHAENRTSYGFYTPAGDGMPELYARRFFPNGSQSGVGTLFHEIFHALADAEFESIPVWFNEGFASLFERGRLPKGKWRYGNPNPWREAIHEEALQAGKLPTLKQYFEMDEVEFRNGQYAATNYNTGRSFFLFLLRRDPSELARFLRMLQEGRPGLEMATRVTNLSPEELQSAWMESVRTVNMAGATVHGGKIEEMERFRESCRDYGLLQLELARNDIRRGREKEARDALTAALASPSFPFPHDAWDLLASIEKGPAVREALCESLSFQAWCEHIDSWAWKRLAAVLEPDRPRAAAAARSAYEQLEMRNR